MTYILFFPWPYKSVEVKSRLRRCHSDMRVSSHISLGMRVPRTYIRISLAWPDTFAQALID